MSREEKISERLICFTTLLAIYIFNGASVGAQTNTAKEDMELQAICAKKAEWFFNKDSHGTLDNYQCHYNKRLNKCFIDIETWSIEDNLSSNASEVYDVFENKSVAWYQKVVVKGRNDSDSTPTVCLVSGKTCTSKEEYDAFVKPYLES